MQRKTLVISAAAVFAAALLLRGSSDLLGWGIGRGSDCEMQQIEPQDGVTPVGIECVWDLPYERVRDILASPADHHLYFSNLAESTVLEQLPDHALVRQVHVATGIGDREVVVEWQPVPIPDGMQYRWQKEASQTQASGKRIEVKLHSGMWEVTRAGDGTRVVYISSYEAGGDVPGFLVRWFQGSGVRKVLDELRTAAESNVKMASSR